MIAESPAGSASAPFERRRKQDMRPALVCACFAGVLLVRSSTLASPEAPPEGDRHVVIAGAASDTLAWDMSEVLPVAISELEKNDWTIQRADSSAGAHRLVTRWKPLKHALARALLDGVMARCVVDLSPMPGNRTVVTIQGGLASRDDLEGSPVYPVAQTTYRQAAERWLSRVETTLETRDRR